MKPAPFNYARPDSLAEALDLMRRHGEEARILAGGQSLGAMLNMRLTTPSVLVDISDLSELDMIAVRDGAIEIGATATQQSLLSWPGLEKTQPLLARMLPHVGHYQTRQRGTVCGSLAHADPSSELPLALALLGGEVVVQGARGRRTLTASEFQLGMMTTALEPGEMITACRFPVAGPGTICAFSEVSQRHGDFAIVAMGAVAEGGLLRLGAAGIADRPGILELPPDGDEGLDEALNDFAWQLKGSDDRHATARYRREIVRRLGRTLIGEVRHASA